MCKVRLIAAVDRNMAIGKGNELIYHIKEDMKHFKDLTMGKAVIMGRKTFESLPNGPLKGRRNIVITRNRDYKADGAEVFSTFYEALFTCKYDCFVIGGAELYKQAIKFADEVYLTEIDDQCDGADKFFPPLSEMGEYEEAEREHHDGFDFVRYVAVQDACPC